MKHNYPICPYNECKREFEKPLMLTNLSNTPRETYYACPHCLTKVDVIAKDHGLGSISVQPSEKTVGKPPAECTHYFGYLNTLSKQATIPDGCLTCFKLLQCFAQTRNLVEEVK